MRQGNHITTYTGIPFYPLDPRLEEVATIDIAHALSLLCRANGHFRYFYSVGQHSLNCSKEAEARGLSERVQLGCLLHDASEAYISDLTRPVKRELIEYLEIEEQLQEFLYRAYGLGDLTPAERAQINEIDDNMLKLEMRLLLKSHENLEPNLATYHNLKFTPMHEIEEDFTKRIEQLQALISLTKKL